MPPSSLLAQLASYHATNPPYKPTTNWGGRGIQSSLLVEGQFKTSKFQNWAAPQPHCTVSPWSLVWAAEAGMRVLTAASPSGNILIRNLADWPRVIIPPTGQLAAATKLPNRPNKRICKLHINRSFASKTQQGFHHDKWNEPYGILCISEAQQRSYCFTANEKELLARALSRKKRLSQVFMPPKFSTRGPFRLMRWVTKPCWDTRDSWWLNVHVQSDTLLLLSIYHAFHNSGWESFAVRFYRNAELQPFSQAPLCDN